MPSLGLAPRTGLGHLVTWSLGHLVTWSLRLGRDGLSPSGTVSAAESRLGRLSIYWASGLEAISGEGSKSSNHSSAIGGTCLMI